MGPRPCIAPRRSRLVSDSSFPIWVFFACEPGCVRHPLVPLRDCCRARLLRVPILACVDKQTSPVKPPAPSAASPIDLCIWAPLVRPGSFASAAWNTLLIRLSRCPRIPKRTSQWRLLASRHLPSHGVTRRIDTGNTSRPSPTAVRILASAEPNGCALQSSS